MRHKGNLLIGSQRMGGASSCVKLTEVLFGLCLLRDMGYGSIMRLAVLAGLPYFTIYTIANNPR